MKNALNEFVKELLEEIFDEIIKENLNNKEKEFLKIIETMEKEKRNAIYETVTGLAKKTNIKPEKVLERLMDYCNDDFEKMGEFCSNKEVRENDCCRCIAEQNNLCTIETNEYFNH